MDVKCPFCKKEFSLNDAHREREIKPGLVEHGLYCDSCKKLVHTYYDSQELAQQRVKIEQLTYLFKKNPTTGNRTKRSAAIASYRRKFEIFQEKILKKFNLPTDDESVIVWDYSEKK